MSDSKPVRERGDYQYYREISTRWADNDAYGHANNVIYYSFFDTAVNQHLIEKGVLDIQKSPVIGLVVETRCQYFSSVGFPDRICVGMKVDRIGNSSVRYELAVFRENEQTAAAVGHFIHVYVDRATNRPVPIPAEVRAVLEPLQA